MCFKSFFLAEQLVEFVGDQVQSKTSPRRKSAKKDEIINVWQKLRPNMPIYFMPIDKTDHSSYNDDGVRITGSWAFISSILARLKDLMNFENDGTKLKLVLRPIDQKAGFSNKKAYVCYINLEQQQTKPKIP